MLSTTTHKKADTSTSSSHNNSYSMAYFMLAILVKFGDFVASPQLSSSSTEVGTKKKKKNDGSEIMMDEEDESHDESSTSSSSPTVSDQLSLVTGWIDSCLLSIGLLINMVDESKEAAKRIASFGKGRRRSTG